jgi:hypothetical protein
MMRAADCRRRGVGCRLGGGGRSCPGRAGLWCVFAASAPPGRVVRLGMVCCVIGHVCGCLVVRWCGVGDTICMLGLGTGVVPILRTG